MIITRQEEEKEGEGKEEKKVTVRLATNPYTISLNRRNRRHQHLSSHSSLRQQQQRHQQPRRFLLKDMTTTTIAEELLSPNNLRIANNVVTYVNTQLSYIRHCPGKMGCTTCFGLIRMIGDSGSSYSLECNCRCHNGPGWNKKDISKFSTNEKDVRDS